jgi:hypothetical protein
MAFSCLLETSYFGVQSQELLALRVFDRGKALVTFDLCLFFRGFGNIGNPLLQGMFSIFFSLLDFFELCGHFGQDAGRHLGSTNCGIAGLEVADVSEIRRIQPGAAANQA